MELCNYFHSLLCGFQNKQLVDCFDNVPPLPDPTAYEINRVDLEDVIFYWFPSIGESSWIWFDSEIEYTGWEIFFFKVEEVVIMVHYPLL